MKHFKRFTACLLTTMLCLLIFAACGGNAVTGVGLIRYEDSKTYHLFTELQKKGYTTQYEYKEKYVTKVKYYATDGVNEYIEAVWTGGDKIGAMRITLEDEHNLWVIDRKNKTYTRDNMRLDYVNDLVPSLKLDGMMLKTQTGTLHDSETIEYSYHAGTEAYRADYTYYYGKSDGKLKKMTYSRNDEVLAEIEIQSLKMGYEADLMKLPEGYIEIKH